MARELGDVDAFLNYRAQTRGGGGNYLGKWTKRTPPRVDVVLHKIRKPYAIWVHPFPRIVSYEKDGQKYLRTFQKDHVCWEQDEVLQEQHRRDRETGERTVPPEACPKCKFLEYVRGLVFKGKLKVWDRVFEFRAKDDEKPVIIHAGAYVGLLNDKFLSAEELKVAKSKGCSPRDAWKEKGVAKLQYLFHVVDVSNVAGGVQKTTETASLGEKVQEVIAGQIEAAQCAKDPKGLAGNPWVNPYAIRWTHVPGDDVPFDKKYKANAMPNIEITDEIRELIESDVPVPIDVDPFNGEMLRASMEKHCLLKGVPWDDIFGAKRPAVSSDDEPEEESRDESPEDEGTPAPKADEGPMVMCGTKQPDGSECDAVFPESYDGPCPKCGAGGAEEPPPPPPPVKKRSEAAAKPEGQDKSKKKLPF